MNDVMTLIPGMSFPTGLGQTWPALPSVSYDYAPNPAPRPQVAPVPTYTPTPTPAAPVASSHQEYVAPVHVSHVSHHQPVNHHTLHLEPPVTLPIHPPPPPPPLSIDQRGPPPNVERGGPFRPSMYEWDYGVGQIHSLPFQTSIFRKSVQPHPLLVHKANHWPARTTTRLTSSIRISNRKSGRQIRSTRQVVVEDTSQRLNNSGFTFSPSFPGEAYCALSEH